MPHPGTRLSHQQGIDAAHIGRRVFGQAALGQQGLVEQHVREVVETLDGYEIILLTGLREERQKSFAEVKSEIIAKKEYNHIGTFWDAYARGLKQEADIRWSPAELVRRVLPQADIDLAPGRDPGDDVQHRFDISAARQDLGYVPGVALEDGIRSFADVLRCRAAR